MELETINKLYLELSQVATTKTLRESELEQIAERRAKLLEEIFLSGLSAKVDTKITKELAKWKPENYAQY